MAGMAYCFDFQILVEASFLIFISIFTFAM